METRQVAEKKAVCPHCDGARQVEALCPAPIHFRPHDPRVLRKVEVKVFVPFP